MTYMVEPLQKNPWPGGHEMYIFGRPFLGHHYYIPSLYGPCPGVEKKIFLRNASILNFLHQNYLPFGHEIYNFLSPYPTDATYQIWLGLAQ